MILLIISVQSKAIAGAKSFGSFLYSAVNKAGKTVSEAGAKIKKTVEENVINRNVFDSFFLLTVSNFRASWGSLTKNRMLL